MKNCSKCNIGKSLGEFHRLASSKDGRRPDCKACAKAAKEKYKKENPILYRCEQLGHGVISRTKTGVDRPSNNCYKENNIVSEIGNTGSEIAEYLYANFCEEIKCIIDEGGLPSLDRIDSKESYKEGNIRIVPFEDNYLDGVRNAVKKTSKRTRVTYPSGDTKLFKSVSEASRELKIKRDTIIRNRDNKTTTKKGLKFEEVIE